MDSLSRDPESPFIEAELEISRAIPQMEIEPHFINDQNNSIKTRRLWRWIILSIVAIECFLGPLNILAGMTAKQGDSWKLLLFGYDFPLDFDLRFTCFNSSTNMM